MIVIVTFKGGSLGGKTAVIDGWTEWIHQPIVTREYERLYAQWIEDYVAAWELGVDDVQPPPASPYEVYELHETDSGHGSEGELHATARYSHTIEPWKQR